MSEFANKLIKEVALWIRKWLNFVITLSQCFTKIISTQNITDSWHHRNTTYILQLTEW